MKSAIALLIVGICVTGCALTNKVLPRHNSADEQRAAAILRLQLNVMRFADEYTSRITDPIRQFQQSTTSSTERLAAQTWLVNQATAAYTIATGPEPQVNSIDMVVFATLSRMVIDDAWVAKRFGDRARPLQQAHAELEQMAWQSATAVLTPSQVDELRRLIVEWRAKNPTTRSVTYIHFDAFAESIGRPTKGKSITPGSLFSFIGLDPLAGLDPAVRELTQTRQLGERALYFAERTPNLVDMQVARATMQFATMPETVRFLDDTQRASVAAQQAGALAAQLPALIAKERAATIDQLTQVVDDREGRLRTLLAEFKETLTAGTATATSLNEAIESFDQLMKVLRAPAPAGQAPGRPFDITEYTATAEALGTTARQLEVLLQQIDVNGPKLQAVSTQATEQAQVLIDHLFWRLLELALAIIAAIFIAVLGYRGIARRWRPQA